MNSKEVLEKLFTLKAGDRRFDPFLGHFFLYLFLSLIFFLRRGRCALAHKTKQKKRPSEGRRSYICMPPSLARSGFWLVVSSCSDSSKLSSHARIASMCAATIRNLSSFEVMWWTHILLQWPLPRWSDPSHIQTPSLTCPCLQHKIEATQKPRSGQPSFLSF